MVIAEDLTRALFAQYPHIPESHHDAMWGMVRDAVENALAGDNAITTAEEEAKQAWPLTSSVRANIETFPYGQRKVHCAVLDGQKKANGRAVVVEEVNQPDGKRQQSFETGRFERGTLVNGQKYSSVGDLDILQKIMATGEFDADGLVAGTKTKTIVSINNRTLAPKTFISDSKGSRTAEGFSGIVDGSGLVKLESGLEPQLEGKRLFVGLSTQDVLDHPTGVILAGQEAIALAVRVRERIALMRKDQPFEPAGIGETIGR